MDLKNLLILSGGGLLVLAFAFLALLISHFPLTPFFFGGTASFSKALWDLRAADILLQVVLIFTAALGILTFFEVRGGRK